MATRRMRAFKRWMISQGIEWSDALDLIQEEEGISVRAVCDLYEADLVATIPKQSCLTIKTSGFRQVIEAAGLEGSLGLSVALMYEKSLAEDSPWFGYLQLLPERECIPLVWTLDQVDSLLSGTELHKDELVFSFMLEILILFVYGDVSRQIVKEDKALSYEDWKECILPLMASASSELNPDFFSVEQYIAAKSLIASRSFEIDDYHGSGMVPLADLFNHRTGAEDVHFTSASSHLVSENDAEDEDKNDVEDEEKNNDCDDIGNCEPLTQNSQSRKSSSGGSNLECSSTLGDDPTVMEMIIVKDVKVGAEVFNTYGSLGNAALLHRYGFTEPDNPYDIVNIDLELVLQWSSSMFSGRHSRARLSLFRRLDYSGCVSQNSEYFEISYDGEPQVELLILLYIMLLPEEAYRQLDLTISTVGNLNKSISVILAKKCNIVMDEAPEMSKDLLLTKNVCDALLSLADIRESLYGSNAVDDDIGALRRCCHIRERKLYHSLMLRVSERRILEKLKIYAAAGARLFRTAKRASMRKKLKRT